MIPISNKKTINKNEIEQVQQQEKKLKLIGKQKKVAGHTLFSFNCTTKEVKIANTVDKVSVGFDRKPIYKKELLIEADCYYEQALNEKNFLKRLKRVGFI